MQTPLSVSTGGSVRLVGRAAESTVLEQFLAAVRGGESRALVLHGEPGIGKTALLEFLVKRAAGCRAAYHVRPGFRAGSRPAPGRPCRAEPACGGGDRAAGAGVVDDEQWLD